MSFEPFIDSWDSGQPGAKYDVGLQWDVNVGPNLGNPQVYLDLVTSGHNKKPKYMQMLAATLGPIADIIATISLFPAYFDLDAAVGDQLDIIGVLVGVSREIRTPLTGVFFSWDTAGVGWEQGSWSEPGATQLSTLPDDNYRTLIRARIAANSWDGSIPGAYLVWDQAFAGTGYGILIQDLGGCHMILALTGPVPDAITKALFTGGYLSLKPAGVKVDEYLTPAYDDAPYFAWDADGPNIKGWDAGAWGVPNSPT